MNTETLHLILSAGLVAAAAALDVAANLMLARSDGFKKRLIGIAALALVGLAFYCLSLAVQYMDLAVAYSMWGSLGILGTSLCGWLFLRQRLKPCAFAGMGLLHHRHDPAAHELASRGIMKGEGPPFPCGKKGLPPLAPSFPQNRSSGLPASQAVFFYGWRKLRDVPALEKILPHQQPVGGRTP